MNSFITNLDQIRNTNCVFFRREIKSNINLTNKKIIEGRIKNSKLARNNRRYKTFINLPNKNAIIILHTFCMKNSFCCIYYLHDLTILLDSIREKKDYKYIILGYSDDVYKEIYDINIPDNVVSLYLTNIEIETDKIKFLPLGEDPLVFYNKFNKFNPLNKNRDILCYCNYGHKQKKQEVEDCRMFIYNSVKNFDFVKCEFINDGKILKFDEYMDRLHNSKFNICPIGLGKECYKFYDTINCGSIPIVVREKFHSLEFFDGVPILFLDKIEDFGKLTKDFLERKWEEMSPLIKDYYPSLDQYKLIQRFQEQLEIAPNSPEHWMSNRIFS